MCDFEKVWNGDLYVGYDCKLLFLNLYFIKVYPNGIEAWFSSKCPFKHVFACLSYLVLNSENSILPIYFKTSGDCSNWSSL